MIEILKEIEDKRIDVFREKTLITRKF